MSPRSNSSSWAASIAFAAVIALCLIASPAHAQSAGTITFTAATTTGDGSVTPVLTWSTSPAADSCIASGDWTGAKGASGTETLPAISASATYNLACTWDDRTATVTWTAPTQNVDGSAYTDAAGYLIEYGPSTALGQIQAITDPSILTYRFDSLAPGTWHFGMRAVNQRGAQSALTNLVSKVIGSASTTKSIGITVNPLPLPPGDVVVQ